MIIILGIFIYWLEIGSIFKQYRIFLRGCWEVVFGRAASSYQQPETTHPLLSETPNNNLSYVGLLVYVLVFVRRFFCFQLVMIFISPSRTHLANNNPHLVFNPLLIVLAQSTSPNNCTCPDGFYKWKSVNLLIPGNLDFCVCVCVCV